MISFRVIKREASTPYWGFLWNSFISTCLLYQVPLSHDPCLFYCFAIKRKAIYVLIHNWHVPNPQNKQGLSDRLCMLRYNLLFIATSFVFTVAIQTVNIRRLIRHIQTFPKVNFQLRGEGALVLFFIMFWGDKDYCCFFCGLRQGKILITYNSLRIEGLNAMSGPSLQHRKWLLLLFLQFEEW